mgnify:FL=1
METIYEKYMALPIDKGLLGLEYGDIADPYFLLSRQRKANRI